jgi:hypothetical protein
LPFPVDLYRSGPLRPLSWEPFARSFLRSEREREFKLKFGGGSVLRNTDCASIKAVVVLTVRLLGVREKILAIDSDSDSSSSAVQLSSSGVELPLSRRGLFFDCSGGFSGMARFRVLIDE